MAVFYSSTVTVHVLEITDKIYRCMCSLKVTLHLVGICALGEYIFYIYHIQFDISDSKIFKINVVYVLKNIFKTVIVWEQLSWDVSLTFQQF